MHDNIFSGAGKASLEYEVKSRSLANAAHQTDGVNFATTLFHQILECDLERKIGIQ
jgi:hypothetical protein